MTAYEYGINAYQIGINAAAQDAEFIKAHLQGQPSDKHIQALKDWNRGWTRANLAAPVPGLDD